MSRDLENQQVIGPATPDDAPRPRYRMDEDEAYEQQRERDLEEERRERVEKAQEAEKSVGECEQGRSAAI